MLKIDHHNLNIDSHKRRRVSSKSVKFRANHLSNSPTILQKKSTYNHTNITQKPLQDNYTKTVSFKGFKVENIPANLVRFMSKNLSEISSEQFTLYKKFIDDFITTAKNKENFRKHIGLSADIASNLSEENLIKLPRMPLIRKFFSVLISPITMFKDLAVWGIDNKFGRKLLPSIYEKIQETKHYDAIVQNYKNVIGLSNYIKIQENLYRANAGHAPIQSGNSFYIPEDILKEKINVLRFKSVDPNKGQYSAKHMALGNRFVSGAVYAVFLSNDAFNTTMRHSNNKNASEEQRHSRANQEFAKIGMNIYIQNLLFGTFENQINRSMTNALLASGITVAASEVIGRALVGRPIFPSNKETLDKMDEEMQNKKGFLASVGRLIVGDKRKRKPTNFELEENEPQKPLVIIQNNFFESNPAPQNSDFFKRTTVPSFKGLAKVPYYFERKQLKTLLDFVKTLDPTQSKMLNNIVEQALHKLKKVDGVNIEGKALDDILNEKNIKNIPIGDTTTIPQRFINGIFAPVFLIKNTFKSLTKSIKNFGKEASEEITPEMLQKTDFKEYLRKRLELPVWKDSALTIPEKEIKIYKEFQSRYINSKLEINGVKNLIQTLEKRFKVLGINPEDPGYRGIEQAKKILNQIMTKADGANHAEYDANKVSQLNINLARAISTIFLVTDSYNLTVQYTNNNKREAIKSAKSRAIQEVSRIASSAYILAFTHSILSKIYNGSLLGAFSTVLLTSVTSDALARSVVGVPITRKTHEELLEIEKKQNETKNPVQKTLAYLIGKKVN